MNQGINSAERFVKAHLSQNKNSSGATKKNLPAPTKAYSVKSGAASGKTPVKLDALRQFASDQLCKFYILNC